MEDFADKIMNITKQIYSIMGSNLVEKSLNEITEAKSEQGSFVYLLYSGSNELLYIGETGASIKARLVGNGSGAHDKKIFYDQVQKVRYYKIPASIDNQKAARKMIEQALSIHLKPKYYDNKDTTTN